MNFFRTPTAAVKPVVKRIILLLFPVVGLAGCDARTVGAQLDWAEGLMATRPDSALYLLQQLDERQITRRSARARYALLYSQALDKNFIDETNDSLIRIARKYYRRHGPRHNRFLAGYYYGRILCNRGDSTGALLYFLHIEEFGRELDDPYTLGLLYHQIAELYHSQYDYRNTLKYAQEACGNFRRAGLDGHCAYAMFDIGEAYSNLEKYDSAGIYYIRSLRMAERQRDTAMQYSCLGNLALAYIGQDQPQRAAASLWEIRRRLHREWEAEENIAMALAQQAQGHADSARIYLERAGRQVGGKPSALAQWKSAAANIHLDNGRYREAAEEFRDCLSTQDSLVRIALQRSYASLHRDYLEKKQRVSQRTLRMLRQKLWLASALFLTIVLFVGYVAYINRRRRRQAVAEYMSAVDEVNTVNRNMLARMEMLRSKSSELRQVVKERFALIDRLASAYYERQGTKTEQKAIYEEVRTLLDSYASDAGSRQKIEQVVNMCYDHVMEKARQELPSLKEPEYDLLCYIYAGFSPRVISVFTKDSLGNVYTKKSRLKSKIAESDAPSKRVFLEMFK